MRFSENTIGSKVLVLVCTLCAAVMMTVLPTISSAGSKSGKLTIYVVNYPLKYFAERIAGEHATVVFPAPADEDPAFWTPDTDTIVAYQKADMILLNGAGYARWVSKVTLPKSRLVDTSKNFKDHYIIMEETVTHSHGQGGEHAHESTAFTTWIDLDLAAKQAGAAKRALIRKKPDLKGTFNNNYAVLARELTALDREIKKIAARNQSQPLIGSHPVYHYLARRYGLNIKSVHWEPDEVPDAGQMIEIRNLVKKHPARWMVWEGDPNESSVAKLKSLGISSLVFDPCGNVPESGDFLTIMRRNAENLKQAFQ
ncbi:metal ABC transporter substrate-binding protein [Thermodesulfobacteriota bacterium]